MNTSTSTERRSTLSASERPNRLATIRRLYFYIVSFISFLILLGGLDSLLRYLFEIWLDAPGQATFMDADYTRQIIAQNGGFLLVATPIFLLHWGYMQRRRDEPGERGAGLRKLFLYLASAVSLIYALTNAAWLIDGLANLALGEALRANPLWPSGWLHSLVMIVLAALLQLYWHRTLLSDGDYGREQGLAGTWRRLYQAAAGIAGLVLLLQGGYNLLNAAWQVVIGSTAWETTAGFGWMRYQLAEGISLTLVGALLANINWQRWRTTTERFPAEATATLRRVYLYVAVVISALATVIPAAIALRVFLLLVLGSDLLTWADVPDRLAESFPYLPVGLVAWIWYWRFLRQEAGQYGETSEGATVRRLYYYIVAAIGLGLLWVGAVGILQTLLDRFLVSEGGFWVEPLATGLSLVIVGTPIWWLHWRTAQAIAQRTDASGVQERASLPRRVYLYGVALVGALLILFHLAQVVYRLLLLLLGDPNADLFSAATISDLARSLIAALLWGVHLLAIRSDSQLQGDDEPAPAADLTIEEQRRTLSERIAQLEQELAAARSALAELSESPTSSESTSL